MFLTATRNSVVLGSGQQATYHFGVCRAYPFCVVVHLTDITVAIGPGRNIDLGYRELIRMQIIS